MPQLACGRERRNGAGRVTLSANKRQINATNTNNANNNTYDKYTKSSNYDSAKNRTHPLGSQ